MSPSPLLTRLQYLATLAHDLNSQALPMLPETFDVLRLPPPHQRLGEVDFNIVPDTELVLESEDDGAEESSDSDDGEDEARSEDGATGPRENGDAHGDADDGDEEMEEVGVSGHDPGNARQVDEDYDD